MVSLTKNLRGKPTTRRLEKVQENLEKDSPWLLVLLCTQVVMELVNTHGGLVWFSAVARLVESGAAHVRAR